MTGLGESELGVSRRVYGGGGVGGGDWPVGVRDEEGIVYNVISDDPLALLVMGG